MGTGYIVHGWPVTDRVDLEHRPFKAGEQKSTLSGNARMFARLLCSVIRTIEQGHTWCERYPFIDRQRMAVNALMDGFASELEVANVIAKLQWCCRAMMYEEILRRLETTAEEEVWADLGRYVKEGRYTAFNSLR